MIPNIQTERCLAVKYARIAIDLLCIETQESTKLATIVLRTALHHSEKAESTLPSFQTFPDEQKPDQRIQVTEEDTIVDACRHADNLPMPREEEDIHPDGSEM